jgi:hypothetical protein
MVCPAAAKWRASAWTLLTSGHVASMTSSRRVLRRGADGRRDAVRGEDDGRAFGNLVELLDEDGAATLELGDDVLVVDDLLADVDRRAALLECELDRLDRALDTGAERPRACEQHAAGPDRGGPFVERCRGTPEVAHGADARDECARVEEAPVRAVDDNAKHGERASVGGLCEPRRFHVDGEHAVVAQRSALARACDPPRPTGSVPACARRPLPA